jgi:hypothetical protein
MQAEPYMGRLQKLMGEPMLRRFLSGHWKEGRIYKCE